MTENSENQEAFNENRERIQTVDFFWVELREYFEPGERHWKAIVEFLNDRMSSTLKEMIGRLVDDDPTVTANV